MAIAGIFLFTLAFNSMDDLYKALLADITGPEERNTLSGLSVVVEMAGQVAILLLGFLVWADGVPDVAFMITALFVAAGVLLTVAGVREPSPAAWIAERRAASPESDSGLGLLDALRKYRGAVALCLVQFAYWTGLNAVPPLVSVYHT
jgi:hypothetical protein